VLGLLGPNGCGKSTLLKILSGLMLADTGTIRIFGEDVTSKLSKIRKIVSYAPGLLAGGAWLDPVLTARQNLILMMEFFRTHKENSQVDAILSLLGLGDVADARIASFSSGMLARLLLAYNLLIDKPIIMMDEPLAGMSPEVRKVFYECVSNQKKEGRTILYVTQEVGEACQHCDRIAIMNKGSIVALDSPDKLINTAVGDVIDLELDKSFGLKEEIEKITGEIMVVTTHENIVKTLTRDYTTVLPRIINFLTSRGFRIITINIHKPRIEDVFIKILEESVKI